MIIIGKNSQSFVQQSNKHKQSSDYKSSLGLEGQDFEIPEFKKMVAEVRLLVKKKYLNILTIN